MKPSRLRQRLLMKIRIEPSQLSGRVSAPPSKSYAHRMLICSALAECQNEGGVSRVEGIADSQDILATKDCISALKKAIKGEDAVFACRESGSTLRFFIPIALALCGGGRFEGAPRLIERGISVYEESLNAVFIRNRDAIAVKGNLTPGAYKMRADVSSQFISGMLFGLSLLEGNSRLELTASVESRAYIDITIDAMKRFGVIVSEDSPNVFTIRGGQKYRASSVSVEGDWSNAAFLYAFNALGGKLEIEGLNEESFQGDKVCAAHLEALKKGSPEIDISDTPDLGPVLFAAAAALHGGKFTGIRRLRIKESDRAAVMAEELSRFGAVSDISENEISVTAPEGGLHAPDGELSGHNDHRIVMALAVLCSKYGGVIDGFEAVSKSWPDFLNVMTKAGLIAKEI